MPYRALVVAPFVAILASFWPGSVTATPLLYAPSANHILYTIDPTTGLSTALGFITPDIPTDALRINALSFVPSGILYGVDDNNNVYQIDPTTVPCAPFTCNHATLIGNTGLGSSNLVIALESSSGGTLYASSGSGDLETINRSTGAATVVGNTGFIPAGDLAFSPDRRTLYMSAGGVGPSDLVTVNQATGAGSLVGAIGFSDIFGLEFDQGILYGLNDNGQLIRIDPATGAGALIAVTSPLVEGLDLALPFSVVPEPSSLLLLGAGLAGIAMLGARQRRRFMR